jgi:uncharacterized protein YndB with AHSA1/START domain
MTTRTVTHSTFTLERDYSASPATVFGAWADQATKALWFAGPGSKHALDFREGGLETASGEHDGSVIAFETTYHEIIDQERINYTSTMRFGGTLTTTSLTTVEFRPAGEGTRLVLTEHGAYLDGHELPEWREGGTGEQLDKLGKVLTETL